jgi:hypothetical protein
MFTAVCRFPWPAGECSRRFADFRGRQANVHGGLPISVAGQANVHGSSPISVAGRRMFTAVRRFPVQAGGLLCKLEAF